MAKTLLIIVFGVLLQLSAVWFLGSNRDGGLFFCCRGVPDDIYHLALTNQLINHFPPQEPGMTGIFVRNYHYLASLVMADLIRVFHLPLISTVYQYFPLLLSLLLGLTTITIAQLLNLSQKITRLWLFFLYFHGDILYLLILFWAKKTSLDVEVFDDATKLLAGPPRAFSILLLFTGIALLVLWVKHKKFPAGLLMALVMGSLVGFKIYTGIFVLIGLAALAIYSRKFTIPALTLAISLLIYLPVNGASGGLIFNGLYRFENFFSSPDFNLVNFELYRLNAIASNHWLKAAVLELFFIASYLVLLYGTSLLGFFQSKKTLRQLPAELNIFLLTAIGVTAIVGLFFLQNIGGLNTVQFLISLYFVGAIYTALAVSRLPNILIAAVILLTIFRPLHEVGRNIQMLINHEGLTVSADELAGLNYLKNNTPMDSVVALPPKFATQEISLYVSFLANRPLYLAGYTGVLEDHQVAGAKERLDNLNLSKINYLYLPKKYPLIPFGNTVFENQEIIIKIIPETVNKSANNLTGVSVK